MIEPMSRVCLVVHKDHQTALFAHLLASEIHLDQPLPPTTHYSDALALLSSFGHGIPSEKLSLAQAMAVAKQLQTYIQDTQQAYQDTPEVAIHQEQLGFLAQAGVTVDKLERLAYLTWGVGYVPLMHHATLKAQLGQHWLLEQVSEGVCYFFYACHSGQAEALSQLLSTQGYVSLNQVLLTTPQVQQSNQEVALATLGLSVQVVSAAYQTLYTHAQQVRLGSASDDRLKQFLLYEGYMGQQQAQQLAGQMASTPGEHKVWFHHEPVNPERLEEVPTQLKNPAWARPFELLVKEHSVPAYNEWDPTLLVAILYPLFFGMMFGDVGQGLVIVCLGLLLFKQPVRQLVVTVGITSMLFGFVYGSVFGFEHVIPALWVQPTQHIQQVIGVSVGLGVIMVSLCIVLGMIQKFRQGLLRQAFTDSNGLIGLSFYGGVLVMLLGDAQWVSLVMIFPFVAKLLMDVVAHPREGFLVVIGTFESLISYATNTLSFIRVGAIVLSHSAMMGAVFMLSRHLNFFYGFIAVGVGNAIVMGVEIMVVAIQALRLNYYEVFSRFYAGSGQPFVSVRERLEL